MDNLVSHHSQEGKFRITFGGKLHIFDMLKKIGVYIPFQTEPSFIDNDNFWEVTFKITKVQLSCAHPPNL